MVTQRFTTTNGWDVSVIDHGYGTPERPFELYATRTTSFGKRETFGGDAHGWLTAKDVDELIAKIASSGEAS